MPLLIGTGWTDDDPDDFPLKYLFSYRAEAAAADTLLGTEGLASSAEARLPPGTRVTVSAAQI